MTEIIRINETDEQKIRYVKALAIGDLKNLSHDAKMGDIRNQFSDMILKSVKRKDSPTEFIKCVAILAVKTRFIPDSVSNIINVIVRCDQKLENLLIDSISILDSRFDNLYTKVVEIKACN